MSQKRDRRKSGIQRVVPNLLQRDEQGAFIDLIQGLRESWQEGYRNFAGVRSSTEWLLVLIQYIITKQHTMFICSVSPSEQLTRGQDYKEKHKLDSKQISNPPC